MGNAAWETVGLSLEETVLLGGAWLLAGRLFRSRLAVFLVSVAAAGSALWANDPGLNLRSVYAVPLLVLLLEEFQETGSRGRLVLAGGVALAQALDLPAGMVPAPFALVLSWFAGRAALLRDRRGLVPAAVLLLLAVGLAMLRRGPAGSPAGPLVGDVLAYAGLRHPGRYVDLLTGAAPGVGFTSFCGYLTVGLATQGLLVLPRAVALRLLGTLLISLLALGAILFGLYALAPGLRPARPIPFGGPWIRLFVVFLAGYGADRLVRRGPETRAPLFRTGIALLGIAACLAWLSGALILQNRAPEDALLALEGTSPEAQAAWFSDTGLLSDSLGASSLFAALAGGTMLLAGSGRTLPFACALVLLIHPLDVFAWKSRMTWLAGRATSSSVRDSAPSAAALINALAALALAGRILRGRERGS